MDGHGMATGVGSDGDAWVAADGRGPRLDRRRLVGGLAAGAAGLLLPRPAAAKPGGPPEAPANLSVRIEVANREWGDVPVSFWAAPGGDPLARPQWDQDWRKAK